MNSLLGEKKCILEQQDQMLRHNNGFFPVTDSAPRP